MLSGFEQLQQNKERADWERFRMLASTLLAPHTKQGKGIKPEKLWPFAWDKKNKPLAQKHSQAKLDYVQAKYKAINNGRERR